jgi:hypothetical protein
MLRPGGSSGSTARRSTCHRSRQWHKGQQQQGKAVLSLLWPWLECCSGAGGGGGGCSTVAAQKFKSVDLYIRMCDGPSGLSLAEVPFWWRCQ